MVKKNMYIMMIKRVSLLLCLFVLTGCYQRTEKDRVLDVCNEFITLREGDLEERKKAIMDYLYFPDPTNYTYQLNSINIDIAYMDIENVQQLSDNLWLIQLWSMAKGVHDSPILCSYFVANIDGAYKIIINTQDIPSDIAAGIDLDPYTLPSDYIHP